MRILIFGGDGMLGHRLLRQLAPAHEARVTLRRGLADYDRWGLFNRQNAFDAVDVRDLRRVSAVVAEFRPQAVINAVGIVKQRPEAQEHVASIEINALFPHRLAALCRASAARLLQLGTDCVFSGEKGNYAEFDRPDPLDLYDRTKLLGEVDGPGALTLRTSMIGPELERKTGLVEWFLAQKGKTIKGYRKAIFSGFTTAELARIIERIATGDPDAHGIYHVSSAPISKFDLLAGLNRRLRLGIEIVPDDAVRCDRSLDSARFRKAFGYAPPAWGAMLDELAADILKGAAR
ncbi:MAG: SDR family oxidoreductase [Betaproteobacteria bacterium]|nr:SDR family oxidoreductase [Betaproteobacteria bacterium]